MNISARLFCVPVLALILSGCSDGTTTTKSKSTSQKSAGGLKPKFTNDIGEFNAEDGKETVDSKVKYSNPITAALEAYDPSMQKIAVPRVTQAVEMFRANEGRYPKDYAEFKAKVVDGMGLRLPRLGVGKRYEYDVDQHKLIVVMEKKAEL